MSTSSTPEGLDLERARDLRGRGWHPIVRRAILTGIAALVAVALTGVFGQPTQALHEDSAAARLRVELPDALRGGLLWRGRIVVQAKREIRDPRVLLAPGFLEGMQINSIEPGASSESNRGQQLVLSYDSLAAGDELVIYLQLQVNPTTVGEQDLSVALDDETAQIAHVKHSITVFP